MKKRTGIINVRGVAAGATLAIAWTPPTECRLKAVEAINNTTAASTNSVYLRKKGGHNVVGLSPSCKIQKEWDGAAATNYAETVQITRTTGLDILIDGSYEVVVDFIGCAASDVCWLKILVEFEEEADC